MVFGRGSQIYTVVQLYFTEIKWQLTH